MVVCTAEHRGALTLPLPLPLPLPLSLTLTLHLTRCVLRSTEELAAALEGGGARNMLQTQQATWAFQP
jgi:hypothetical protein